MAQITLHPPATPYMLPNTGSFSIEAGDHFKFFVDSVNSMFNDLYSAIGGSPTQHVTLRGPAYGSYLPNHNEFIPERGDSFKVIINQINSMFSEVYSIEGITPVSKVTLQAPATKHYLPNYRDYTPEHGDSFSTIVKQIIAMMTECYANTGGGGGRLALGARVAMLGDSITQYNNNVASQSMQAQSRGEMADAQAIGPNFNFDAWLSADNGFGRGWYGANFGYAGETSSQILGHLPDVLAAKPDICFIAAGTNDSLETAGNPAKALANCVSMANQMVAVGIKVVATSVRPRGSSTDTTAIVAGTAIFNAAFKSYALATTGVTWCDLASTYDRGDGMGNDSDFFDGVHPMPVGAERAAHTIVTTLATLLPAGNWYTTNYWASGNLIPNPTFTGTAGTFGSGHFTGQLPTGWQLNYAAGSTITTAVVSVTANATTGGQSIVLAISPGAGSGTEGINLLLPSTVAVSAGSWYMAWAEVETDGVEPNSLVQLSLYDNAIGSSLSGVGVGLGVYGNRYFTATDAVKMSHTVSAPIIAISVPLGGAPYTLKIHRIWLGSYADPHIAWNSTVVPTAISPPTISGTISVGQVLTAVHGGYSGLLTTTNPSSFTYQWSLDGVPIGGATSATYTIQAGDAGHAITVSELAANAAGFMTTPNTSASVNTTFPGSISDLFASPQSTTTVLLTFTNPSNFTSLQYRQSLAGNNSWSAPATATSNSFTVTGLSVNTSYDFEVRGVNGSGNGMWSNISTATTNAASLSTRQYTIFSLPFPAQVNEAGGARDFAVLNTAIDEQL